MKPASCIHLDVHVGESIVLDGRIRVELEQKSGRIARLKVSAPDDVSVKKESGTPPMRAMKQM
jgi:hypothetical protein